MSPTTEAIVEQRLDELEEKLKTIPMLMEKLVAAEREACAKIAEAVRTNNPHQPGLPRRRGYDSACEDIAEKIRARGIAA